MTEHRVFLLIETTSRNTGVSLSTLVGIALSLEDAKAWQKQGSGNEVRSYSELPIIASDIQDVSDGYHTFRELYAHRCILFVALCWTSPSLAWRSRLHADGTGFDGWFIAGMNLPQPTGQKLTVTYHLPDDQWDLLDGIKTLEKAPEWDGHDSDMVRARIWQWATLLRDSEGALLTRLLTHPSTPK